MGRMVTVKLEMYPSEEVSVVSTVTGYISKSEGNEKIIQVLYDGFSDRNISTLRVNSEQCKLLTSSGDIEKFNLNSQYIWENEKEIIVYGMKVNGGDDMIVIRGALNGYFKLSREDANIEIGNINLSIHYERHYGWHIECTGDSSVQVVDNLPPKSRTSGTETIRVGTDSSLQPINYNKGVKEATIKDCTNLLH